MKPKRRDPNAVLDGSGKVITKGDCVKCGDARYAVLGLSECCGSDIVVLGELVGAELAKPYCELASWVTKV